MWALVRLNRRYAAALIALSLLLFAAAGFTAGGCVAWLAEAWRALRAGSRFGGGFNPMAGLLGIEVAVVIWIFITVITYWQGDRILLATVGARPLRKEDHPQLYNVIEEMSIAAALPRMPRPYVIDDPAMNALAAGFSPDNAAIAVTAGALARLNRDQLQGIVAHETAHIANGDVLFMTLASLMTGAARGPGWLAGQPSLRRNTVRFGGEAPSPTLGHRFLRACSGFLALLAPVYAVLVLLGTARRRDFLADACAAVYTRYPEGLASGLYVMAGDPKTLLQRNRHIATLCTLNPYRKEYGIHTPLLFASTHAPVQQRIAILRGIHVSVSYERYERAWKRTTGGKTRLFPRSAMTDAQAYPIREAHPEAAQAARTQRRPVRNAGDLIRGLNDYKFLSCACGMRIKLPPWHARDHATCPRCGQDVRLPTAQPLPKAQPAVAAEDVAEITRPGKVWLSFRCVCGGENQLSPFFDASRISCVHCGRGIRIRDAAAVD